METSSTLTDATNINRDTEHRLVEGRTVSDLVTLVAQKRQVVEMITSARMTTKQKKR